MTRSTQPNNRRAVKRWLIGIVAVAAGALVLSTSGEASAKNRYVGVKKCKKCHGSKDKGDQHKAWKKMKHANAFKVLASPEAKKVGKKLGVANPQTSKKCLKCHETGYGKAAGEFSKTFKKQMGVQCESCHGPGQKHFKVRFREEQERDGGGDGGWDDDGGGGDVLLSLPRGELGAVNAKVCKGCHNKDSPSFKKFDYAERCKEIAHLDPRKDKKRKKKPCAK